MPAYNFQKRFVPLIESGAKRQTIRATVRGARPGGTAYLYTGMRTKKCKLVATGVIARVRECRIYVQYGVFIIHLGGMISEYLCGVYADKFAVADGFRDKEQMQAFFEERYGLPFSGVLIEWELAAHKGK